MRHYAYGFLFIGLLACSGDPTGESAGEIQAIVAGQVEDNAYGRMLVLAEVSQAGGAVVYDSVLIVDPPPAIRRGFSAVSPWDLRPSTPIEGTLSGCVDTWLAICRLSSLRVLEP